MVARGPGAVGCAHCKRIGAAASCEVCTHSVCATCAADWSTCDQPSGRTFRLGRTGRLIDVDPGGRWGLVSRWFSPLRIVELRGLRWLRDVDLGSFEATVYDLQPRLTEDGRMIVPRLDRIRELDGWTNLYGGLELRSWTPEQPMIELPGTPRPVRSQAALPHGAGYAYVNDKETVTVVVPGQPTQLHAGADAIAVAPIDPAPMTHVTYDPLPRKVVQQAFVDVARRLLAAATWGQIVVHQIVGDRLVRRGAVTTTGDVSWLAVAGGHLAAGVPGAVKVWRLEQDDAIGPVVLSVDHHPKAAALSRDGAYLAVGIAGSNILVYRIGTATVDRFDEHTDDLRLVRFVGEDDLLVTADDDNRVVIGPRTATGYARKLMTTTLREG